MAQYQRHYVELGAGPYVAKRVAHEDGTFSLSFGEGETVIGRGNTREDAARHLMRLVGQYLAGAGSGVATGPSQSGSSVNPFSKCEDYDRGEPW